MGVKVGIIMGSQSDWPTMKEAAAVLDEEDAVGPLDHRPGHQPPAHGGSLPADVAASGPPASAARGPLSASGGCG